MSRFVFRPLRVAKRQLRRPWSSDPFGQADDRYAEKVTFAEEDGGERDSDYETESSYSSRATSDSHQPMLGGSSPPKDSFSAYDPRKHRRKFNKYFTLALLSLLAIFILTLVRLGYSSANSAKRQRPSKPFPYESFPFLKRYHGGIRTLLSRADNVPEYPGENEQMLEALYNITDFPEAEIHGRQIGEKTPSHKLPQMKTFDPLAAADPIIQECFLDADSKIKLPKLHGFEGVVKGFPDHILGSYEMLKIDNSLCFDRFGRLGPYGFGYSRRWGGTGAGLEGDREGNEQVWAEEPEVDFRKVKWAEAQDRCAETNSHRFSSGEAESEPLVPSVDSKQSADAQGDDSSQTDHAGRAAAALLGSNEGHQLSTDEDDEIEDPKKPLSRNLVLIRTWHDYEYDPEDILYLRALISELSLASGTEYLVQFLIHVRNNDLSIWSDGELYQRVLNESLPEEFRGMGTLWSDKQMELIYPGMDAHPFRDIHLHGNYRSAFMPIQYFAHLHPEYDFIWHWEMDSRYTGHFYHLFDRVAKWAKRQPRKGLWERNARFYIPSEHGDWEDFRHLVRVQTEHGSNSKLDIWSTHRDSLAGKRPHRTVEKPIWGPEPPIDGNIVKGNDPQPPTSFAKDDYKWGVGEDADLITFNPIFNPESTGWNLENDVTGYNLSRGYPPRRASIVAASRLSRRLLNLMHEETAHKKHTMFSEMWPASCALHHGLKAVYVPHPEFIDRRWPTDYLDAIYNGGRNGASGGSRMSAFNDENQGNFLGISWYYHAGFPGNLWKRWLGYKVDNDGGEKWEVANEGRMCLPPMLLHPVKQVNMVYEHRDEEKDKTDMEKHAEGEVVRTG